MAKTVPVEANIGIVKQAGTERVQSEFERANERINVALNRLSNSMDRFCCQFAPVLRQIPTGVDPLSDTGKSSSPFDDFIDSVEYRINIFSDGLISLCDRSAV